MIKPSFRRRRMSMTSLIDVIFLLLLFFMLSSTFSRFAEIEIAAAGAGRGAPSDNPPVFVQLYPDRISVNAVDYPLDQINDTPLAEGSEDKPVKAIVALRDEVDSQTLVDFLASANALPGADITVLGR